MLTLPHCSGEGESRQWCHQHMCCPHCQDSVYYHPHVEFPPLRDSCPFCGAKNYVHVTNCHPNSLIIAGRHFRFCVLELVCWKCLKYQIFRACKSVSCAVCGEEFRLQPPLETE